VTKRKETCSGCGSKFNRDPWHKFCDRCAESPLNRSLIKEPRCRKGHLLTEVGITPPTDNTHWRCKQCETETNKKRWADETNKQKIREASKRYRVVKEYGITPEQWMLIHASQGGICAICKKPIQTIFDFSLNPKVSRAAVDHDHKTGLIRGLVCQFPCNYILGHLHDSIMLFRACADYLENPPASKAFGEPVYTLPGKTGTKKRAKLLKKQRESAKRMEKIFNEH
jgi:hypothetical protein